jgi:adenine phosphoribosyltransferase
MPAERRAYLQRIDTHTPPGARYDVTPLFGDYQAFSALLDDLLELAAGTRFDVVVGIDALGFILGAGLALRSGVGFVPIRKGGKLPGDVDTAECVDYTGQRKALELRRDAITPGARALVVDEWIETGAQVSAAIQLLEARGAVIAGIATIQMDTNQRTASLAARYPCFQVASDL